MKNILTTIDSICLVILILCVLTLGVSLIFEIWGYGWMTDGLFLPIIITAIIVCVMIHFVITLFE